MPCIKDRRRKGEGRTDGPAGEPKNQTTEIRQNGGFSNHSATSTSPTTQAEVQALRDACEVLADDVRALSSLVHALRGALVSVGVVKGGA